MQGQIKKLLIAGIPLHVALFMIVGRDASELFLPNFIEEISELMWQATIFLNFIVILIPREILIDVGVLSCRVEWDGWCWITPHALIVFALLLSAGIYFIFTKVEKIKKGPRHNSTAPKN